MPIVVGIARGCFICGQPMLPYQVAVYLDSGAVVHGRCRSAFRGTATTAMAVIRPTTRATRLRARERRAAGVSPRAFRSSPVQRSS